MLSLQAVVTGSLLLIAVDPPPVLALSSSAGFPSLSLVGVFLVLPL